MKLGLLGGTFDPPHNGHLALAETALTQLGLDHILWILTADPPHKQGSPISPALDRLELVLAAIAPYPAFQLSRVDLDRPGPHWAADTVALLHQQFPEDELIYLMGSDSLRNLPTWGRPQEFLRGCWLGVLGRPDESVDWAALETQLPGIRARVRLIAAPPLAIASREIRKRIETGLPLDGWVPPAVERLIQLKGLYRKTP